MGCPQRLLGTYIEQELELIKEALNLLPVKAEKGEDEEVDDDEEKKEEEATPAGPSPRTCARRSASSSTTSSSPERRCTFRWTWSASSSWSRSRTCLPSRRIRTIRTRRSRRSR